MSTLKDHELAHEKQPSMSRSRVTLLAVVSLGGFVGFVMLWLATFLVASFDPNGMSAITIGYGHKDAWLVNAVIYANGLVVIRQFDENLTYHLGPYAKLSDAKRWKPLTARSFWPQKLSPRVGSEWSIHLVLPIALFAMATLLTVVRPWYQKRRRVRFGHCKECGYNLLKNESGVCPECGTSIASSETISNDSLSGE